MRHFRMHFVPVLLGFALCAAAARDVDARGASTSLGFVEIGRDVRKLDVVAAAGFAIADVDGDGLKDAVFTASTAPPGSGGSEILAVIGRRADGSLGFKQLRVLPTTADVARISSVNIGGTTHIVLVSRDGLVRDFAGWPLLELGNFAVQTPITGAATGDLYGNGGSHLVVVALDRLYAYSLDKHQPLWNLPVPTTYGVVMAQLDGDPASEIVIGSTPGLVIDGATQATDWQYADGFNGLLAAGQLANGAAEQFVVGGYPSFTVFGGTPWAALWSAGNFSGGIGALSTASIDASGRDVVIEGDSQWGSVHVFDAATHQERFSIPNPGWGVNAVAAADFDGDRVADIVFANSDPSNKDGMQIVDSRTGQVKWRYGPTDGPFSAVALGDVDGDGREDLVAADATAESYAQYGPIQVLDALTGALEWQSPPASSSVADAAYIGVSAVRLRPRAGSAVMDMVFAGNAFYDGRVTIRDGATRAVMLDVYAYSSGPLNRRFVTDAILVDYDRDGIDDIAVTSQPSLTSSVACLLQVFSGTDGHVLWTSPSMPCPYMPTSNLLVTGPATSASSELIAVTSSKIYAYNLQSGLLDWSQLATSDGATFLPQGVGGGEIAVFAHNGAVTFYDATTHAYLRSFGTMAPLNALAPLEGDPTKLLVASGNALQLIDAQDGAPLARTEFLGESLGIGNRLAQSKVGDSLWHVAAGNRIGTSRFRIELLPDALFADDFESVD